MCTISDALHLSASLGFGNSVPFLCVGLCAQGNLGVFSGRVSLYFQSYTYW